MPRDYDIIILGSGPAGFSCAMQSSKFDKNVLVVESHETHLGGTWINTGTVPSKSLREAAKTILEFNKQFNSENDKKPYDLFKMEDLLKYKNNILERENRKVKDDFINNKVDVARGFGQLVDEHTIEVETHIGTRETYTAEYILIATGSSPAEPDNFAVDDDKILDYKSILNITHIPRRLVIVGGGVHAMEYATIFAALGTRITVLSSRSDDLYFLDDEIKTAFFKALSNSVSLKQNIAIEKIGFDSFRNSSEIYFRDQKEADRLQVIQTEHVLYLGGREPNIAGIGLDATGIKKSDNAVINVNEQGQTSVENIYAAGDVIGFPRLASASLTQGRQAACNMFGIPSLKSPDQIPYGIYTIPEISNIGFTEQQAIDAGIDVTVGRAYFKNIVKADMNNHKEGLLKLVFNTETLKLLGVHIVGDQATNLIHLGQSVIAFNGDVRYFIQHVMNYPTLSEAYRIAAFNGVNRVYKAGVKYRDILDDEQE
jgi:NAD(P) transhydrogenase